MSSSSNNRNSISSFQSVRTALSALRVGKGIGRVLVGKNGSLWGSKSNTNKSSTAVKLEVMKNDAAVAAARQAGQQ